MAREFVRLCWSCEEIMSETYFLTEEPEREEKRGVCRCCGNRGYFSLFSFDPSRPRRTIEEAESE